MEAPRFLTPLDTRHLSAIRKELIAPLEYLCSNGTVYTIPSGFYSDGASVPRPLWALYPPFGEVYEPATWLHDYCYAFAERIYGTGPNHTLARVEADGLLYEAMHEALGYRRSGSEVMYYAVRAGGWRPWRRYRREAASRGEITGLSTRPQPGGWHPGDPTDPYRGDPD